ncbi:DUF1127 domain-containing protein [Acidisoma cladoniae]|jgi:uncharacterized protein YjiS (DUF1127 family)|uniref:DUF1127 domain-containing protein n=1 Tax=Acidisoma cladoniae TaxID=3040935 RepID=UPI00254E7215|nr:DUF1127 domain-containing protein [Acidisoma sp. PAMC 29798]
MVSFADYPEIQADRTAPAAAIDFLGFTVFLRAINHRRDAFAAGRAERLERRQVARELSMFSDRELSELGFSRADLGSIEAGSYRR